MKLEKYKVPIIFTIFIIIMFAGVIFWNSIIKKTPKTNQEEPNYVDVSDANNVSNIDAKLGGNIRITAGYLLTYTTQKSSIWYMSKGYVASIKTNKETTTINIKADQESQEYLIATIDNNKNKIKKNDLVYFVGNIDLGNNQIKLTKINTEPITYKDVTEIELVDLLDNINKLKQTTFTISGYMITDNTNFKLFDTKTTYQNNNTAGNYFLINWQDKFNLTGNDNVKMTCSLAGTYKLKECVLK